MQDGARTRWWREQSKDATGLLCLRLGGYAGPAELDGAVMHANQVDCLREQIEGLELYSSLSYLAFAEDRT